MDQKKWIDLKSYLMSDKLLTRIERKNALFRFRNLDLFDRIMKLQSMDDKEARKLLDLCSGSL